MKVGLSRDYLNIDLMEHISEASGCGTDTAQGDQCVYDAAQNIRSTPCCGGNQQWFGGMMARCGCSIISAADTVWYLRHGKNHPSLARYQKYIRSVRRFFPLIPFKGMPGLMFGVCLNLYLKHLKLDYRASWGVLPWNIHKAAAVMLAQDIPVPFCVGPCFARFFSRSCKGLKLYERNADGSYAWTQSIYGHFMVITEIENDWAKVSSWGKTYYIRLSELEKFALFDFFGLLTNITQIHFVMNGYKKHLFD